MRQRRPEWLSTRPTAGSRARAGEPDADVAHHAGALLRMQRLAGNAAVTSLIQVYRDRVSRPGTTAAGDHTEAKGRGTACASPAQSAGVVQRAASRSVSASLQNKTDETLHQASSTLSHGVWAVKPPADVPPGTTVRWSSESSGVMTGTEGSVDFSIEGAASASRFTWDNPFIGSNSAVASAPLGYKASRSGMSGNNATVGYELASDRHPVTIGGEQVNVASDAEKQRAEAIIKAIKDDYGVTVSSSSGVAAVQSHYSNVPAAVTSTVSAGVWELKELVALQAALAHFAPILGKLRASSSAKGKAQEVLTVGKVKRSINANTPAGVLDNTTLGEMFRSEKNFSMFNAGTRSTVDFKDTGKQLEGTAIHEMAHGLMADQIGHYVNALDYWTDRVTKSGKAGAEAPITTYGQKNASEDLSEAVMIYFMDQPRLKANCPTRFAFIKAAIAAWTPPPSATP